MSAPFEQILFYTFLSFTLLQLLFIFLADSQLLFYKKPAPAEDLPPISLIIAAHNELANLQALLPLLEEQNHPEFEIIIIDDRSDEEMQLWLLAQRQRSPRLKVVRIDQSPAHISPKKYAVTLGVRAAQYEHLLFTDADCRPQSKSWISQMAEAFSAQKQIVLGVSPYIKKNTFLNYIIRCETFFTAIQYLSFKLLGMPYMGVGRNLAYTKSLFLQYKGFSRHQHLLSGDDDLFVNEAATRKNTAICINAEAHCFSQAKESWRDWWIQKTRHLSVGKYYRAGHRFVLGSLYGSHVLFWVLGIAGLFFVQWPPQHWLEQVFLAAFGGRILLKATFLYLAARRAGLSCTWFELLGFDLLYVLYILVFGLKTLFSKAIKWS